jgi:S-adenosylmethionine decarboxylase
MKRHCLATIQVPTSTLLNDRQVFCALLDACHKSGLSVLQSVKHEFHPQGLTAVVLLAESHLAIHTYPELGLVFADAFTCGDQDPSDVLKVLVNCLKGELKTLRECQR